MSVDSPYSRAEEWLHHLALSSAGRLELAFSVEKAVFGRRLPVDDGRHVFVCGLARAGTTLLMNLLHETGRFSSLTYRDMPFVLSPNFWSLLSGRGRKASHLAERAHGDGMLVGYDSPEAFEEVFWRVFCGGDYIFDDCLSAMEAPDAVIADFRTYLKLVLLRYGGDRYLSKNNNNILRIPSLLRAFPRAQVLVPFRHPMAQARSLQRQHDLFCDTQRKTPFVRRYMDWLVHCEFGANHKPFFRPREFGSGVDYWTGLWTDVYQRLLDEHGGNPGVRFLCYEDLCSDPQTTWQQAGAVLGESVPLPDNPPIRSVRVPESPGNSSLQRRAEALYQVLRGARN